MKKHLLLLIPFLMGYFVNYGQNPQGNGLFSQQHQTILKQLFAQKNQQRTAMRQQNRSFSYRVIGQSTVDNTMSTMVDSVNVGYDLNGTSVYDFGMLLYPYNYTYNTTPRFNNFLGYFTQPQITHTSFNHWTVNPNTLTYGFYEKRSSVYDAYYNQMADTSWLADSLINPNTIGTNTFNLSGNPVFSYKHNWVGGLVDSAFKQYCEYNTFGQLVKDSVYEYSGAAWHIVSRTQYTYDGSGNLTFIDNYANVSDPTFLLPLVHQLQYTNTYDGSNRLLTVQTNHHDGTSLIPYVRDTFSYTGALNYHTGWKEYQYDPINALWSQQLYMTKSVNLNGFPDTIETKAYDFLISSWVPYYKYIVLYDANDNPIQLNQYNFNFISYPSTPDFTTHYYYEAFTNTTSIPLQKPKETSLSVYPNPASNNLTIKTTQNKTIQYVQLIDVSGRVIKTQSFSTGQPQCSLSVAELSAGFYRCKVTFADFSSASENILVK